MAIKKKEFTKVVKKKLIVKRRAKHHFSISGVAAKKLLIKKKVKKAVIVSKLPPIGVKVWADDLSMSQIYSSGLEYAFVSPKGEQCHAFAYCKDFLQDALWGQLNNKKAVIYKFVYEKGKNAPIDTDNIRVAVRIKGEKSLKELTKKALKFVQEIDIAQGFIPSKLEYAGKYKDNKDDVWVFIGDKNWLYAPALISFYTLAIRTGMNYEGGGWSKHLTEGKFLSRLKTEDKQYCNKVNKYWDKFIGTPKEAIFGNSMAKNYPPNISITNMHNNSGFVSLASGASKQVFKHWNHTAAGK